jgi:pimeloyl-ACP methyl ester carboxylesterase
MAIGRCPCAALEKLQAATDQRGVSRNRCLTKLGDIDDNVRIDAWIVASIIVLEAVTPILHAAEHHVSMVDLPGDRPSVTMEDYVECVQAAISSPRDTVLVAHSSSGLVGSVVAQRLRMRELVLLAAFLPRSDMSVLDEVSKCPILEDKWVAV